MTIQLCDECNGTGQVDCDHCDGMGYLEDEDRGVVRDCRYCDEGKIECPVCKGERVI
jgi:hypothetical protein